MQDKPSSYKWLFLFAMPFLATAVLNFALWGLWSLGVIDWLLFIPSDWWWSLFIFTFIILLECIWQLRRITQWENKEQENRWAAERQRHHELMDKLGSIESKIK